MAALEPTDEPHREPTPPPAWWGRADRGPTTAELRAHVLEAAAGAPAAVTPAAAAAYTAGERPE